MKKHIWIAAVSAGVLMLSACADPAPSKKSSSGENDSSVATSGVRTSEQDSPDQSGASEADASGVDEMGRDADEYARFKAEQESNSSSGGSAEKNTAPPIAVRVEIDIDDDGDTHQVAILKSLVDGIEIRDVSINRGNCQSVFFGNNAYSLEFGQTVRGRVIDKRNGQPCSISEVSVRTDQGFFTFPFE